VRAIYQFIRPVAKILNYGRYIGDIARRLETDGFRTGRKQPLNPPPPDKIEGPRQRPGCSPCDGNALCVAAFIPHFFSGEMMMGRGILLWLIGVPIPVIILLALFVR
jgi:hypothetical protein